MAALGLVVDRYILLEEAILVIADNCSLESRRQWPDMHEVHALGRISSGSLTDGAPQLVG